MLMKINDKNYSTYYSENTQKHIKININQRFHLNKLLLIY